MLARLVGLIALCSALPFAIHTTQLWSSTELGLIAFNVSMPVVAGVAVWIRLRNPVAGPAAPMRAGSLGILAGVALTCAVLYAALQEPLIGSFGLWLSLVAAVGLVGSGALASRVVLPLFPLALTAPLTHSLAAQIELALQHASAWCASVWLPLIGYEVERRGLLLFTASFQNLGNETCSGVSTLSTLVIYAILIGVILSLPNRTVAIVSALTIPLSIALNGARIAWISVLGERGGTPLAMGPMHDVAGIVVFGVGYALLFLTMLWLYRRRAVSRDRSNPPDPAD